MRAGVVVHGDDFFGFLAHGRIEPWLPEAHAQNEMVVSAAAAATGRFVAAGHLTIYDGVLGPWFATRFAAAAGLSHFDYAVLLPPVGVCLDRIRSRTGQGFGDEDATQRLHDGFSRAGIASRHVIDTEDNPATVADAIVRAHHGRDLCFEATARR